MPEINSVFRRVRNHPNYIKENGTISSAIFLDSKGVSVDIDDGRSVNEIISAEEALHVYYNSERLTGDPEGDYKLMAIVSVTRQVCEDKQVMIELSPVEKINPYHAILRRDADKVELSSSQRRYLKNKMKIVKSYDESRIKSST